MKFTKFRRADEDYLRGVTITCIVFAIAAALVDLSWYFFVIYLILYHLIEAYLCEDKEEEPDDE